MTLNQKLAALAGIMVTGLTLVISLSPTIWIIAFGSALLVIGFSLLSTLESLRVNFVQQHWFYVIPMISAPTFGGIVHGTEAALWAGLPVAVLGGLATHCLITRFPLFRPVRVAQSVHAGHD